MPATPEFGYAAALIRRKEVGGEGKTEPSGYSQCDIAVTAKVAIDHSRITIYGKQAFEAGVS